MNETRYTCVKCGKLLLVLAKGSKYSPEFRAICSGCSVPEKPSHTKSMPPGFDELFSSFKDMK